MRFTNIEINAGGNTVTYLPYDRGQNGAFVWKQSGANPVYSPRLIVSSVNNDAASDKMTIQSNTPSVRECDSECPVETLIGTDIVKTELRFLATTKSADRIEAINKHIAVLQELRVVIEQRDTLYS